MSKVKSKKKKLLFVNFIEAGILHWDNPCRVLISNKGYVYKIIHEICLSFVIHNLVQLKYEIQLNVISNYSRFTLTHQIFYWYAMFIIVNSLFMIPTIYCEYCLCLKKQVFLWLHHLEWPIHSFHYQNHQKGMCSTMNLINANQIIVLKWSECYVIHLLYSLLKGIYSFFMQPPKPLSPI